MGTLRYDLKIHERDDYFFFNNTFSCKSIEIEKVVKCRTIYTEDSAIIRNMVTEKLKVVGKKELYSPSQLHDSVDAVIAHLKSEYVEVHEDKHHLYLLEKDEYRKVICLSKPGIGMGFAPGTVDLYTEYKKER